MRLSILTLLLFPALSVGVLAAHADKKKEAMPTEAAIKEATSLAQEVYKADFSFAKTSEQKIVLARKLLDAAKDEKGAGRYVLLTAARDLEIATGNVEGCDAALSGIESSFDGNGLKAKADAYAGLVPNIRAVNDRQKLGEKISIVVQAALADDRFDLAKLIAEVGLTNARVGNDAALAKLATGDMQAVREAETTYAEVKKSLLVLADKPSDPDANLKVGKYRSFIKDDWKSGLPMLALGNDATLKALSQKEIAGVTEVDDKVKVGDGWWDVGEKLTGLARTTVQKHAAMWYREALPSMEKGMAKTKVEQRLAKFSVGEEKTDFAADIRRFGLSTPIKWADYVPKFAEARHVAVEGNVVELLENDARLTFGVSLPDEGSISFSIFLPEGQNSEGVIFSNRHPNFPSFTVGINKDRKLGMSIHRNGWQALTSSQPLPTGKWADIIISWGRNGSAIVMGGKVDRLAANTIPDNGAGEAIGIGAIYLDKKDSLAKVKIRLVDFELPKEILEKINK